MSDGSVLSFTLIRLAHWRPTSRKQGALAAIAEGLERAVDPRRIQRAARLLQGYELLYWDTIHQASIP